MHRAEIHPSGVACSVTLGAGVRPKTPPRASTVQWQTFYNPLTPAQQQHAGGGQQTREPTPAAALRPSRRRVLLCGAWALAALLLVGAITAIVLYTQGVFSSGSGNSGQGPLPYFQRQRNIAAQPAFLSELHAWLLPAEQQALGLPRLDADVIIVGAGMAGLAAASALRNMSVLVLEARDRVGGRIHSMPFGRGGATTAELGAQFIWGSGSAQPSPGAHPLTVEANRLGLERVMVGHPTGSGPRQRQFRGDGTSLSTRQLANLLRWQADFEAFASGATGNQSLADVLQLPEMQARLAGSPDGAALLGAALAARHGVHSGASLSQLSALYHDNYTSFPGPDNIVLGGFDRLPLSYAAPLLSGARLQLSTPVASIRHTDSGALVTTADGRQLAAQYVICTIPLGVLQSGSLVLNPPLPEQSQAALRGLGVGHLEKLWLEFDTAFWEDQDCGAGTLRAPCEQLELLVPPARNAIGGVAWRRFISMAAYTRRPVLAAVAAEQAAQQLGKLSEAEAVASAMSALQAMFPGRAPAAPRSQLLTRWGQDPWAQGSLSYYAVGGTPSDRATLAEPQSGSLVLAGEATSVAHPSTVHGALLSGLDAAYRVLDAARELPQCTGGGSGSGGGSCVAAEGGAGGGGTELLCECDELPPLPIYPDVFL